MDYKTYNCTLSGDVTEVNNIVLQNINESYYNIYAMNDGGYSVIEYYTENKKINKSVITKYRSNNTIEWTKEVSIENYGAVINLNQIDDNNYAMVLFYAGSDPKIKIGEKNVTIHKNFKTGFESDDSKFMGTVIAKLDNNGDLIYSKCMENFQIENFLNKDKDKFFVLGLSLGTILDNGKLYEPGSYVMIDFDEYYNELDAPPVPTPTEEPTPNVPTLEPSDSPTSKPSESPSVAPTQHTKNPSQQEVSPNDSDNDSSNGDNSLTLDDYYKKASKDKYDDANGSANIDSSDTTYKNVPSESPDTGDTIIISIIILAISFIGTIVILAIKIRNKE